MQSYLFIFAFVPLSWGDVSKKTWLEPMTKTIMSRFSFRIVTVSGITFKSLIHFEFIFISGIIKFSLIVLQVGVQFSQHHLFKRLPFPHCMFLYCLIFFFCINFLVNNSCLSLNKKFNRQNTVGQDLTNYQFQTSSNDSALQSSITYSESLVGSQPF